MKLDVNKLRDTLSECSLMDLFVLMDNCECHGMRYFSAATNEGKDDLLKANNAVCQDRAEFFIFMAREIEYEIINRYAYIEEHL